MCEKGSGHISLAGEHDHGACGSHYYATVYVELDRASTRETPAEFQVRAEAAGKALAEQLNRAEEVEMAAWKEREDAK